HPAHEVTHMKSQITTLSRALTLTAAVGLLLLPAPARASSHMDAPLITLDDAANTTDVYAFVSQKFGRKYLSTALAVYPHEEPGIGPNKYNFDDDVLYEIRVATGNDVAKGRTTVAYQFAFDTTYRNRNTILQSYLGVISDVGDEAQNLIQRYTVTKVDWRTGETVQLGRGIVPPNNQGNATPRYNRNNDGEQPARDGVANDVDLDVYTAQSIAELRDGYFAFAGQRDDGFYADIQAIFDLLKLRGPGQAKDSQGGFNVHTMVLNIPIDELGGDRQIVGVYATTSRRRVNILAPTGNAPLGDFVQVARQGNPLFNEGLVAIKDKDLYSRTSPEVDGKLFRKYAVTPELAALINALVLGSNVAPTTNRTDIAGIFIPDLIKVDLSTGPARLAGGGASHPTNPDDAGFSRLGIFGGDTLTSTVQSGFGNGTVPGGWPNGRRFGDDVVDIAVTALISDLRVSPPIIVPAGDNVDRNDIAYNKVFPYAATPLNGRTHTH
ncbi:MAG TPA: DUF4331 domain-containing protein, partial [Vicinamibacterales bacterium]|nr:DUF4331 domain-containing protein [Vicinamibacterales bacterium]